MLQNQNDSLTERVVIQEVDPGIAQTDTSKWHPVHFDLKFLDGSIYQTDTFWYILLHTQQHPSLPVYIQVRFNDGYIMTVDGQKGFIQLGESDPIYFRESFLSVSRDVIWFRRTRSEILAFNSGLVPSHTYVYAWGFGFATGEGGRRVFLFTPEHQIIYEG